MLSNMQYIFLLYFLESWNDATKQTKIGMVCV